MLPSTTKWKPRTTRDDRHAMGEECMDYGSDTRASRSAGVTRFGYGGSNAHVVLEEYREGVDYSPRPDTLGMPGEQPLSPLQSRENSFCNSRGRTHSATATALLKPRTRTRSVAGLLQNSAALRKRATLSLRFCHGETIENSNGKRRRTVAELGRFKKARHSVTVRQHYPNTRTHFLLPISGHDAATCIRKRSRP
ncbi:hypothetical protein EDC01DRAFT_761250 [Geopyxis carbonaria]|nr:hypothetical protein EDC01DRAFT_761250 [Geopyxis carbonaria]